MVGNKVHTFATHAVGGVSRRNERSIHSTMQASADEHERSGRGIRGIFTPGTGTRCGEGDDVVFAGGGFRAHSRSESTVDSHRSAQVYRVLESSAVDMSPELQSEKGCTFVRRRRIHAQIERMFIKVCHSRYAIFWKINETMIPYCRLNLQS